MNALVRGTAAAFPCVPGVDAFGERLDGHPIPAPGMTQRTYIATQLAAGMLAAELDDPYLPEVLAQRAVAFADALLVELGK